jgi:hypothetical protein
LLVGGGGRASSTGEALSAGDVNGDGINDMIVGAPTAWFNGHYYIGRTYVVFGRSRPFPRVLPLASLLPAGGGDGSAGFVMTGVSDNDESGGAVSGIGDVNADGISDLIVGALRAPDGASTGAAYVVFGSASGFPSVFPLGTLLPNGGGDGSRGFALLGDERYEGAGTSVSAAGDVNGDGIDDFIVGAPGIQPSSTGKVYVLYGRPGPYEPAFKLADLRPDHGGDGSAGFIVLGIDDADNAGEAVSGAGDVNGDGIDDILIGADGRESDDELQVGSSYVIYGRASNFPALLPLASIDPASGGDGSQGFVLRGIDALDSSGSDVSAAGDINADGIDDLVIAAPYAERDRRFQAVGESYVVYGRSDPFPARLELTALHPGAGGDGSAGFIVMGVDPGDYLGYKLAGAGDVNADGIDDLIFGAPFADPFGLDTAGEAYVLFGRADP